MQTLSVTATDGALRHTAAFPFYVADYSDSLSQNTLTLARGATSSVTGTVNVTNGFGGTVSYACAGTTEVTCSFAPVAVNPTPSSPGFTTVPITASYSALMLSPKEPIGRGFWLLASALPFGIFLGATAKKQMSLRGSIMTLLLPTVALASLSCGGGSSGGGGGGGGGSNTYSITVTAAASGTNTTRTLGTLNVTVTH